MSSLKTLVNSKSGMLGHVCNLRHLRSGGTFLLFHELYSVHMSLLYNTVCFLKDLLFLFYVFEHCLNEYMYIICMSGAQKYQKRALDSLDISLKIVVGLVVSM